MHCFSHDQIWLCFLVDPPKSMGPTHAQSDVSPTNPFGFKALQLILTIFMTRTLDLFIDGRMMSYPLLIRRVKFGSVHYVLSFFDEQMILEVQKSNSMDKTISLPSRFIVKLTYISLDSQISGSQISFHQLIN